MHQSQGVKFTMRTPAAGHPHVDSIHCNMTETHMAKKLIDQHDHRCSVRVST